MVKFELVPSIPSLTVSDIGRMGGNKRKMLSPSMSEIGRKGAEALKRRIQIIDPGYYSRIAKAREEAKRRERIEQNVIKEAQAPKGVKTLKERYGSDYFKRLAKKRGDAVKAEKTVADPDFYKKLAQKSHEARRRKATSQQSKG